MHSTLILTAILLLTGCLTGSSSLYYGDFSTYSADGHLQMIVEIPAGTNKKIEYDYETNTFPADVENGVERVIDFLPYPGNYGFISSTMMDSDRGGDGDALDILLLSEHLPTGTIIEVLPIGVLVLEDGGEDDSKIIAVPVDKSLQVINITSYQQFHSEFYQAKHLIQLWFLGYKGGSIIEFKGWEDEIAAKAEIEKWSIKK
jgi:inorganic pyrophosphatase